MSKFEEEGKEYFAALGSAIASWQNVERRLSMIFSNLVQSKHGFAIFDAILSTRDKIGVLDEVLQRELRGEPLLTNWNALHSKLQRMSRRRNKIVHAYTSLVPKPGRKIDWTDDFPSENLEYVAGPGLSKALGMTDPIQRLKAFRNVHQLNQLARAFGLLNDRVHAFDDLLLKRHNESKPPSERIPVPEKNK
jgi:hypothetical protein